MCHRSIDKKKVCALQSKQFTNDFINDQVIRGLPEIRGEVLKDLFTKICVVLRQDTDLRVKLFRIGKFNKKYHRYVIVKFASRLDKDEFFRMYIKHKSLNTVDLGFPIDSRIYVNENIPSQLRQIFRSAVC